MAIHLTPEANPTVQEGTLFVDSATGEFNVAGRTVPHIIPGVLYPAVSGNDINGNALGGSYVYGTAHTDGRKYYYTDIKGSKPIKDPRIGGHFGSQRHKFKSIQLLEQETATHGDEVYSVDGRDWIRRVGKFDVHDGYGQQGHFLGHTATGDATNSKYFEIVGYFNAANYLSYVSADRNVNVFIDGTQNPSSTVTAGTAINTPLANRYVDSSSVINIPITGLTTPGIHTLKIANVSGDYLLLFGIELIAQDTSNRNNIQIPSQNVVSYGKKFTVSGTPHYDPFNGFSSGSSVTSYIDTATSLGVENWKNSSTYYRPYNGGRVVKWVDSSGVIKTSVTLMPPNARSIGNSSSLTNATAKANASIANNTFYPTMEAGAIDHSLSELAKAFHWREFGNGAVNGGAEGTYADASMLASGSDDIAYVMDDGLTSLSGDDVSGLSVITTTGSDYFYITFVGTGISWHGTGHSGAWEDWKCVAQNLPYGSHIIKFARDGSDNYSAIVDGVTVYNVHDGLFHQTDEVSVHQPKKPPIPEDACVIADYMLMADFVPQTSAGLDKISKGVRIVSSSRDVFYNSGASLTLGAASVTNTSRGFIVYNTNSSSVAKLPFFGTNSVEMGHLRSGSERFVSQFNGSTSSNQTKHYDPNGWAGVITHDGASLGLNTAQAGYSSSASHFQFADFQIASPIHTSHHYQSFETPFLHELVGGDRNLEQNNLVVSPDGKTWDQITRNKSYLASDLVLSATTDTSTGWSTTIVFDEWRGIGKNKARFNKDSWAIAYNRLICLKDGTYEMLTSGSFDSHQDIYVNGTDSLLGSSGTHSGVTLIRHMKRGDYIEVKGDMGHSNDIRYGHFFIKRVN